MRHSHSAAASFTVRERQSSGTAGPYYTSQGTANPSPRLSFMYKPLNLKLKSVNIHARMSLASPDTGWLRQVTFPTQPQVYRTVHPFHNRHTVFEIITEAGDFMVRPKALQEGLHLNKSIWGVLSVSGGSALTGGKKSVEVTYD